LRGYRTPWTVLRIAVPEHASYSPSVRPSQSQSEVALCGPQNSARSPRLGLALIAGWDADGPHAAGDDGDSLIARDPVGSWRYYIQPFPVCRPARSRSATATLGGRRIRVTGTDAADELRDSAVYRGGRRDGIDTVSVGSQCQTVPVRRGEVAAASLHTGSKSLG